MLSWGALCCSFYHLSFRLGNIMWLICSVFGGLCRGSQLPTSPRAKGTELRFRSCWLLLPCWGWLLEMSLKWWFWVKVGWIPSKAVEILQKKLCTSLHSLAEEMLFGAPGLSAVHLLCLLLRWSNTRDIPNWELWEHWGPLLQNSLSGSRLP